MKMNFQGKIQNNVHYTQSA